MISGWHIVNKKLLKIKYFNKNNWLKFIGRD